VQYLVHWMIFVAAACLEVGGDAIVRKGLRGGGIAMIVGGCLLLAFYGVVVNLAQLDFSRLLGIYVGVFAVVSVLAGKFYFGEAIGPSTWIGLAIIVAGGLVIQFGGGWPAPISN
jgi:multidrug transporter EmrE-like cation transporter